MVRETCEPCRRAGRWSVDKECRKVGKYFVCSPCLSAYNEVRTIVLEATEVPV
ncbi:hypothetical protein LCGC14_1256450 [marine sediment metagenome]|uniref:Uncharacterized protein n=1 Tax=marine sediment metagenome TaxID=412755 RepID=A0A0F9L1V2_9ZZZZ